MMIATPLKLNVLKNTVLYACAEAVLYAICAAVRIDGDQPGIVAAVGVVEARKSATKAWADEGGRPALMEAGPTSRGIVMARQLVRIVP